MKEPKTNLGIPVWWHMHGMKMEVLSFDKKNLVLTFESSAATLVVTKASVVFPGAEGWLVDWKVVQSTAYNVGTVGRAWFGSHDLSAAFGINDISGSFGKWVLERYGGTVASQGKYIRYKNFLNIPCPGTGHDGDPNISIHLDDNIKDAIQKLLSGGKSYEEKVDSSFDALLNKEGTDSLIFKKK